MKKSISCEMYYDYSVREVDFCLGGFSSELQGRSQGRSQGRANVEAEVESEVELEVESEVESKVESKAESKVSWGVRRWGSDPPKFARKNICGVKPRKILFRVRRPNRNDG